MTSGKPGISSELEIPYYFFLEFSLYMMMNSYVRIYDWEGELKQRLPSGELHVNGDLIAISSNSNDQVVVYSLSEILELPIFNIGGAF